MIRFIIIIPPYDVSKPRASGDDPTKLPDVPHDGK